MTARPLPRPLPELSTKATATAALRACAFAAATLCAAAATPSAHAEVAAADPIDAAMRACLARADMSSTAGQLQCMDTARLAWQTSIDQTFPQVLTKVPADQRKKWQDSEQKWKVWREADGKMLSAVTATTQGTRYQLSEGDARLQAVRDRALLLRSVAAKAGGPAAPARLKPCSQDAQCEHAMFDVNRYYRRLVSKMPSHTRTTLWRAQQAWIAYRDATAPLVGDARGRLDLIGARIATLKKLADTAGND